MAAKTWHRFLRFQTVRRNAYPFVFGILVGSGLKDYFANVYKDYLASFDTSLTEASNDLLKLEEKYGFPNSSPVMRYSNHVLHYDNSRKVPLWVAEHLSKEKLYGSADRSSCSFKIDHKIPEKFRSRNEDYFDSGYARGHMIPAADVKFMQRGMEDTFYLSNIVPQNFDNNGGFWYRLELYCRSLAKKYSNVYVISGPLFKPMKPGQHQVKYQLIGKSNVAVPTHFYKIILVENKHERPVAVGAFVIPNTKIDLQKKLTDYQVQVEDIEKWCGCEFFPKLMLSKLQDLCKYDTCKLLSQEKVEMYNLSRSIKYANTLEELDNIWNKVQENRVKIDKKFMDKLLKKKKELAQSR